MKQLTTTALFFAFMYLFTAAYTAKAQNLQQQIQQEHQRLQMQQMLSNQQQSNTSNGFWDNYDAACPGCRNGNAAVANAILVAQRNQQEFVINQQRAARGLPPCSLAPLGFLLGKTAC